MNTPATVGMLVSSAAKEPLTCILQQEGALTNYWHLGAPTSKSFHISAEISVMVQGIGHNWKGVVL